MWVVALGLVGVGQQATDDDEWAGGQAQVQPSTESLLNPNNQFDRSIDRFSVL